MNPLIIEETPDTPYVCLDKDASRFEIKGASLPPNIFDFYNPVIDWLRLYSENPNRETVLELKFEYLNSSSTKMILNIISILEKIVHSGMKVGVRWYYDFGDKEMKEMGEDFASNSNIPFKMVHS